MEKEELVDITSFLVFEGTGDSEVDYYDPNASFTDEIGHDISKGDDDDDESCSYDVSDSVNISEFNIGCEYCDVIVDEKYVRKTCFYEDDEVQQNQHSTSDVSVDSNLESLTEMEKNRLFWEDCLAS